MTGCRVTEEDIDELYKKVQGNSISVEHILKQLISIHHMKSVVDGLAWDMTRDFSIKSNFYEITQRLAERGCDHFIFPEDHPLTKELQNLLPRQCKFTKKIYFVGEFALTRPIPTDKHKCLRYIHFKGTLIISNIFRTKDIELPDGFTCETIKEVRNMGRAQEVVEYENAKAYVNRPARLARLEERRKERETIARANQTGVLTIADAYQVPLEVGCTTVYCGKYLTVEKQEKDVVVLRDYSGQNRIRVHGWEIMRLY